MPQIGLKERLDAVCAGHICLDITPIIPDVGYRNIQDIFRPGKLVNVDGVALCPGGPVANVGLALARLGIQTAFMAKIGRDAFGKVTLEYLENAGNIQGVKSMANQTSSYTVVLSPPGIDRIFLHHPGPNDTFTSDDINYEVVRQAKLFHFGYPPIMQAMLENGAAELVKTFRRVKQLGVTTALDMSLPDPKSTSGQLPWKQILADVLPYVDIFMPSIEEAIFCLDPVYFGEINQTKAGPDFVEMISVESFVKYGSELLNMGCKMVALTAAHRGFYFRTADENRLFGLGAALPSNLMNWAHREIWCPAFYVFQIVNATGAGDATFAGLLAGLLNGLNIEQTLKIAACLGYQNLHGQDGISGIKGWDDTLSMLDSGNLHKNENEIEANGWYWDKAQEIWFGPNDRMIIK